MDVKDIAEMTTQILLAAIQSGNLKFSDSRLVCQFYENVSNQIATSVNQHYKLLSSD